MISEALITVTVDFGPYRTMRRTVCREVSGPFFEQFAPVDVCKDPFIAAIVGGVTESAMLVVRTKRAGYAKLLAEEIASALDEAMSAEDTKNGYKQEKPK